MNVSPVVRFSEQDLGVFSAASGDRNPLHVSSEYASRTAYGQQVVFGALGCIASLTAISRSRGIVSRVTADFHRPMFLHIDYRAESKETRNGMTVRLLDGSTPVLTTFVQFSPEDRKASGFPTSARFPLEAPRVQCWEDLRTGSEASGEYSCEPGGLTHLYERWSLDIDPIIPEALLWSSYFVGMELPGQSALFFRIVLDFHDRADSDLPFRFHGRINHVNPSIAQIRTAFQLQSGNGKAASGQITSFVRPEIPALRLSFDQFSASNRLEGKVAVVIGASRGLGAALTMTLAAEGVQVVAIARSAANWPADLPPAVKDRVTFWQGDAESVDSLAEFAKMIGGRFGKLDFVICSAFPAIPSLRLEPSAAARIGGYIRRATDLVLGPLCHLLPLLTQTNGCAILISSAAVENPVRDWPHYVAAKAAAEAFFRVAPLQFPETSALIVRPERLLTEMTNTPMGRQGATSPLMIAHQICNSLPSLPRVGTCKILDLEQWTEVKVKDADRGFKPREIVQTT